MGRDLLPLHGLSFTHFSALTFGNAGADLGLFAGRQARQIFSSLDCCGQVDVKDMR